MLDASYVFKELNCYDSKCSGDDPALVEATKDKALDLLEVFHPVTPIMGPVKDVGEGAEKLVEGLKVTKKHMNDVRAEWANLPGGSRLCAQKIGAEEVIYILQREAVIR